MRINKKNIPYLLGSLKNCYAGYSNEEKVRENAASGGIVSAILIYLLENKIIDGALVSKIEIKDGELESRTYIAKSKKEILNSQKSIYYETSVLSKIGDIKKFKGKLAIVGLPYCQIKVIRNLMQNDKVFNRKIELLIGLFCGHNSKKELLERVLEKKKISISNIKDFVFRKGHWRGKMQIILKNGKKIAFPFQKFSTYQNLHFLSQKKCIFCSDHTAEEADISCGDVWLKEFRKKSIKHSIFITRNTKSDRLIQRMVKDKQLIAKKVSPLRVCKSQKRALIFHKSVNARSVVGKIFGYKIKKDKKDRARINEIAAATIVFINDKISDSRLGKKILFSIPRPLVNIYLYVFKLLTNF